MSRLLIKENGLTARTYYLSREVWENFKWNSYFFEETQSDLCTMVRSIFILMPLAWAINIATIFYAGWVLLWFFSLLWVYLTVTALVMAGILAFIGFIVLIYLVDKYGKTASKAIGKSETVKVIGAYYKAKKEKICPLVEMSL